MQPRFLVAREVGSGFGLVGEAYRDRNGLGGSVAGGAVAAHSGAFISAEFRATVLEPHLGTTGKIVYKLFNHATVTLPLKLSAIRVLK